MHPALPETASFIYNLTSEIATQGIMYEGKVPTLPRWTKSQGQGSSLPGFVTLIGLLGQSWSHVGVVSIALHLGLLPSSFCEIQVLSLCTGVRRGELIRAPGWKGCLF